MPQLVAYSSEVNIVESNDYLIDLARLIQGGNILLVTSSGFTKRGAVSKVIELFGKNRVMVFDQVTPNPEKVFLQSSYQALLLDNTTNVVALGGGSVIDTAKVFSALLSFPEQSLDALLSQKALVSKVNLIAIPTTAGTGAEVTPFATVWESETNTKHSLSGIKPSAAVLDANLTLTLPYYETLYPALDALSHALESLWNKHRTLKSQQAAISAIELICDNLPIVLKEPQNLSARQNLLKAATQAGLAISTTKTALAHAISYPLTLKYAVPHGLACSFSLLSLLNIVGNEKLNLSINLSNKVKNLLNSLGLQNELSKFVGWQTLVNNFEYQLDPSRAGNFIEPVDEYFIKRVFAQVNTGSSEVSA
ncbi:phosphonoacetaldehyde reductase [Paraglaciecola aquimarina]|uniref:Phosphonoacetaldehyde reductase n=1 Tax=Paraglaciecola algarum TaxID=3050085 RepID=A0ABS9D5H8_9ALTE|nr:phosphonoacetaldehyde reductase [Paraglaciecola sp. G1-23]MCF2948126.1 phosphonoacetaldehyde reductase [Paraglaciecola sp. G1-23]